MAPVSRPVERDARSAFARRSRRLTGLETGATRPNTDSGTFIRDATMATPTPTDEPSSVVARRPEFPQLDPRGGAAGASTLDSLRDVPITITARLGHTVLPIGEILTLGPGSVVELQEAVGSPIELTVRGVPFALGEVVVVDDRFAVRIKSLLAPRSGRAES